MTGGRKKQSRRTRQWRVVARGVRRDEVDVRKLGRAVIALAQAKTEADARAEHQANQEREAREGEAPR